MNKLYHILIAITLVVIASCTHQKPADGEYTLHLLSTNDIHGSWFDIPYTSDTQKKSIFAINTVVQKFRDSLGEQNVILVDAGDCLQGDNAPYYFNYIDTNSVHLFARLVSYMKYDAVAVGNHDIETGHSVYDRVTRDMNNLGVPFLAGNAIRNDNGKSYFQKYIILKKGIVNNSNNKDNSSFKKGSKGELKVAILGYTNPNMKAWLAENLWSGMQFESLIPIVQNDVNEVIEKEEPAVVIVVVHSGVGEGDGTIYESQGLDLYKSLQGVDFLVCSHDHKSIIFESDTIVLLNSGSHARNVAHGELSVKISDGIVVEKKLRGELLAVDISDTDTIMRKFFSDDYNKVKEFTLKPVGDLNCFISTKASFAGMCNYMNLIHSIGLKEGANISIAAPLTYNKDISPGKLLYNDLFTLYPFENQMYFLEMSGDEIKKYLEYSYDNWINTISLEAYNSPDFHLLKIVKRDDTRNSQVGWSFVNRSYNFDSAGGLNYSVDVTKNCGERINISSLANGEKFELDKIYTVAMTSYRASGGGELLSKGAGLTFEQVEQRIIKRLPEYREILYKHLLDDKCIDSLKISDPKVIGHWEFVPKALADRVINRDMQLLFNRD